MQSIPPLGWALIILLILFIVGLNLSLLVGIKKQKNEDHWTHKIGNAWHVMRNPLQKENDRYDKLAEQVKHLKENDKK